MKDSIKIRIIVKNNYVLGSVKRKQKVNRRPAKRQRNAAPVARYSNLKTAYRKKSGVVPIRNIGNELCCASAIIMALERYGHYNLKEKPNRYVAYMDANKEKNPRPGPVAEFTEAARYLHQLAG